MEINLQQPKTPDIYSFGFNDSLNLSTPQSSNTGTPTVYDIMEGGVPAQLVNFGGMVAGSQNTIFIADPSKGIWLGNALYASAPFRVNMQGQVFASDLMIETTSSTGQRIVISSANNALQLYDSNNNSIVDMGSQSGVVLRLQTFSATKQPLLVQNDAGTPITGGSAIAALAYFKMSGNTSTSPAVAIENFGDVYNLLLTQNSTVSNHFKQYIALGSSTGGFSTLKIWVSDGTNPNGNLSGTAGDPCFNGTSNQLYVCNGGTAWSQAGISSKFGGNGSDGALTVTSGTTNIDLGGNFIVVKNYTSISITGTGAVTFSNPHSLGTYIILKSQGSITITSSASIGLDASGMGSIGGNGAILAGTDGQKLTGDSTKRLPFGTFGFDSSGTNGYKTGGRGGIAGKAGGGGSSPQGAGGASPDGTAGGDDLSFPYAWCAYIKYLLMVGSGGGGGGGDSGTHSGGDGGRGGAALYMECASSFNFTGSATISVAGKTGAVGSGLSGSCGGGGGGGGLLTILYNSLTANSGTASVAGGPGGIGAASTGGIGANGFSTIAQNNDFT